MFRHLFTLIWNKKKQNALLITEIFISFLVIFAVFTLIVYDVRNYLKPLGFDYSDVWVINYDNTLATNNGDSLANFYGSLKKTLLSMPEIRYVSYTADNFPYSQSTNSTGVKYSGSECQSDIYTVEESYKDLFNIPLMEGRWFGPADQTFAYRPIVINEALKENLFHDIEPVGKQIGFSYDEKTKYKVVGVVNSVKAKGDYTIADPAYYILADTGSYRNFLNRILLKVTPGADAAFEGRLYKTVANALANANIEIEHLANKRTSSNYFSLVPMIISLIVAGFLIINVALGLFGVLWYNINKRKGEIGLRRAVGASGRSVSSQLVSEAMIIATFSLILGMLLAIQFPLLHVFALASDFYLIAMGFAILFIYLLVLICSLYPGRQAAAIYPAVALHEE